MGSTATDSNRPRTRQRIHKPPPVLDVPDIDKDAAERKRVLNVLAQRRYRERKRKDRSKTKSKEYNDDVTQSLDDGLEEEEVQSQLQPAKEAYNVEVTPTQQEASSPSLSQPSTDGGVALQDIELSSWDWEPGSQLSDPSAWLAPPNAVESLPGPDSEEWMGENFSMPQLFSIIPPSQGIMSDPSSSSSLNMSRPTTPNSSDFGFPDSYLLPVHELTLLKALLRISGRLGVNSTEIWKLECQSPFTQGTSTPIDQLPAAWRPTASQLTVPHHPVFDLLPWPSARDRILMFQALPDEARPPNARGPMALVNFVYDLEDNSEGVRIYGEDPCDPDGWEVGQILFERWWFLFDRAIIANSNRWRGIRGAPPLQLKEA